MTMPVALRKKSWSRKQKRLATIAGLGVVLALAATLVLVALRDQIVFFYSPSDVLVREVQVGTPIRLGGLVKDGTWVRDGQDNTFTVTDGAQDVLAHYTGILPDLFREGQGVVAEGSLQADGSFKATNVLAKHDENYVPKEVVEALKASGEWRPETAQ
jgi:cytochrome c-type biogenesis protein CcmE